MKQVLLIGLLLLKGLLGLSQTKISGIVTDTKGELLPGVNVSIKGTYDGSSTSADGKYEFTTEEKGEQLLQVSFVGFEPSEQKVNVNGADVKINIKLKEKLNELDVVTISAGAFEASDEKKMVILRSLDIVTTAGANGDIYGALQTLPGTQQIGESEGLFVRGGDASETKTIIDGQVVANPYFSSVPDVPQRGRFSPFLFKGTYFSTGGYSALYGQAMSSALVLETQDLPDKTTTNIGIMSIGPSLAHTQLWNNKTSLSVSGGYVNLSPYYWLVKQNRNWVKAPEGFGSSLVFRHKTSSTGMLKAFVNYGYSALALNYNDIDDPTLTTKNKFSLYNNNTFSSITYKELIAKKWTLNAGASYSTNNDNTHISANGITYYNDVLQGKIVISHPLGKLSAIRFGGDLQTPFYKATYNKQYTTVYDELYSAGFAETDVYITKKIVARLGARFDNSRIISKQSLAHRISLAYKTSENGQVSFATGYFYQNPDRSFITPTTHLDFERATHYILNYQVVTDRRTFRVEGYAKDYKNLVKFSAADTLSNGSGYAQGFDVFWRDKKTFKNTDYWISYSFLDTKRNYRNYPYAAVPNFAATHTVSLVYKYFIEKINSNIGLTYAYASGRTYYNPNNPAFLEDRTRDYHNLSLNCSYLTLIKSYFTVLVLSVNNILGVNNVFNYHYSADGLRREAVIAPAQRMIFIGMFISIGEDNTSAN